jgi:hypothetical protein
LDLGTLKAHTGVALRDSGGGANTTTLRGYSGIPASFTLTLPSSTPGSDNLAIISSGAGALSYNDQALLTTSNVQFNRAVLVSTNDTELTLVDSDYPTSSFYLNFIDGNKMRYRFTGNRDTDMGIEYELLLPSYPARNVLINYWANSASTGQKSMRFFRGDGSANLDARISINNTSDDATFNTYFCINDGGAGASNFGIGTQTPATKLEVTGTGITTPSITDGTASWSSSNLSGFGTISCTGDVAIQDTGSVYAKVSTTTTGSPNEGGLLLNRGDQANGFAQVHYTTAEAGGWYTGLRATNDFYNYLYQPVGVIAYMSDTALVYVPSTYNITHTGATKLIISSTSGTVDIESVNFSGQAMSNISTITSTGITSGFYKSYHSYHDSSISSGGDPFIRVLTTPNSFDDGCEFAIGMINASSGARVAIHGTIIRDTTEFASVRLFGVQRGHGIDGFALSDDGTDFFIELSILVYDYTQYQVWILNRFCGTGGANANFWAIDTSNTDYTLAALKATFGYNYIGIAPDDTFDISLNNTITSLESFGGKESIFLERKLTESSQNGILDFSLNTETDSYSATYRFGYDADVSDAKYQFYKNTTQNHELGTTGNSYVCGSSGNFGVGDTTPGEKLEVTGNIKFSGNLKDSTNTWTNELGELTAAEVQQLQNIGTTTISSTQWGYLGGMTYSTSYNPIMEDMSDNGFTMSSQHAFYSVIGDMVSFQYLLRWTSKGSASGTIYISLPYTASGATDYSFSVGATEGISWSCQLTAMTYQFSSVFVLADLDNTGGAESELTDSNYSSSGKLVVGGFYFK